MSLAGGGGIFYTIEVWNLFAKGGCIFFQITNQMFLTHLPPASIKQPLP